MSNKALQMLEKRREEILSTIQPLELELVDIDKAIAKINGTKFNDKVYDDENPDCMRQSNEEV